MKAGKPTTRAGQNSFCRSAVAGCVRPECRRSPGRGECRRAVAILLLAVCLYLSQLNRALGENQVAYRYENYREEGDRIGVDTHSVLFEQKITPWLTVQGHGVYDAISGATP